MAYLIDKFKGTYRIRCPFDQRTNSFPRKFNDTYEDVDLYIDCQNNIQVSYYGHSILMAYIPSKGRGRNIIKAIKEDGKEDMIFNIEETDSELLFRFHSKYMSELEQYLKPKTSGSNISPYSTKNLPRAKYSIPDEDLNGYKTIVSKLQQNELITLVHSTKTFLQALATKKNTWEDIKADMAIKGLKGKEYIHCIGQWDKYLDYLRKELQ